MYHARARGNPAKMRRVSHFSGAEALAQTPMCARRALQVVAS